MPDQRTSPASDIFPFIVEIQVYEPGMGWLAEARGSSREWLREASNEAQQAHARVRAIAVPYNEVVEL
jgi:hypothetical protein